MAFLLTSTVVVPNNRSFCKSDLKKNKSLSFIKPKPRCTSHVTNIFKENFEVSKQIIEFAKNHHNELTSLSSYSLFQLSSWILPMIIAGRLMDMSYKELANGILIIAILKSALNFYGIIHY